LKENCHNRAVAESAAQNAEFSRHKLIIPVLALGGQTGVGDSLRQTMEALAHNVKGGVIPDCGHYMMEEQPELVARELLRFFERNESDNKSEVAYKRRWVGIGIDCRLIAVRRPRWRGPGGVRERRGG
jgi:hypothetical protein